MVEGGVLPSGRRDGELEPVWLGSAEGDPVRVRLFKLVPQAARAALGDVAGVLTRPRAGVWIDEAEVAWPVHEADRGGHHAGEVELGEERERSIVKHVGR